MITLTHHRRSMSQLYYLNVSIHVLAAVLWVGGMFFLALVGAPVLRTVEPASLRSELFSRMGRRFRSTGWLLIGTLVATGVLNLWFMGLLGRSVLTSAAFWGSSMGQALIWKLVAVTAMIVFSAAHDFLLGPRATRLQSDSPEAGRARRSAVRLARLTALAAVVAVLAAVRLARGG